MDFIDGKPATDRSIIIFDMMTMMTKKRLGRGARVRLGMIIYDATLGGAVGAGDEFIILQCGSK